MVGSSTNHVSCFSDFMFQKEPTRSTKVGVFASWFIEDKRCNKQYYWTLWSEKSHIGLSEPDHDHGGWRILNVMTYINRKLKIKFSVCFSGLYSR
ncbi:hypothetical protein PanWU01x14_305030 [Parasponia andersonii]|uniref:Uncharacterized protein n=1 Tax=Parasponia andersonii TaxID=3476 RepID=A0A2P5ASB8_PARAD|nr:hypothetical protein PanWU01x14_305030 [Parasponia andersonii]